MLFQSDFCIGPFFVQHEIASLSCVLLMPPPSEYCERGGSSEWCFMHWGTTIRLQVEAWPDVARMILSCLFVLGDSTGWSLVWPSSHDLVIFSCRGLVKLQQPCKQARVRMLSMEPFGRKYKLTTAYSASQPFNQRQSTWDPWTFFVWWLERLSDELMNVVQLLEAFFYSQDLKQLCWWRTSFRKDNASECWPGCSNQCSYSMHSSDSCLHLKWSSSRKVSYKSKHLWIV